jgi:hypothetical protein
MLGRLARVEQANPLGRRVMSRSSSNLGCSSGLSGLRCLTSGRGIARSPNVVPFELSNLTILRRAM